MEPILPVWPLSAPYCSTLQAAFPHSLLLSENKYHAYCGIGYEQITRSHASTRHGSFVTATSRFLFSTDKIVSVEAA
jgi:hypothetical protein